MEEKLDDLVRRLGGEMINVGKPVKTVKQAVEATGLSPKQIIKSLLFISEDGPILAIVDGSSRVDLAKLRKVVGGGEVRLARPDEVKRITKYEVGSLPPIGVKARTIVDPRVLENRVVVGGGGSSDKLSKLDPRKIIEYQKAEVADIASEELEHRG